MLNYLLVSSCTRPWPLPPFPNGVLYTIPNILTFKDIWLDPAKGADSNTGASANSAFKSFTKAWAAVPKGVRLSQPHRIRILNGTVPGTGIPEDWVGR